MSIPNPDNQLPPRPANDDPRNQPMASYTLGDLQGGYHMDLRGVAGSYGPPGEARGWFDLLAIRREHVLPVTVLQLGLGAWQRGIDELDDDRDGWNLLAQDVATWAAVDMDGHGRFIHHQPMPHTYAIPAPWYSAMAQGLAASLLARCGDARDVERSIAVLLDPASGLVASTEHGPVLEEYPSSPPAHVLNGWIWALFGLHDASLVSNLDPAIRAQASEAFMTGVATLAESLGEYETGRGWSTYDRYPHPVANVASPFYHRLHVHMLGALARIAPQQSERVVIERVRDRWQAALHRPLMRAGAVARKVGFRLVRPRGRRVG